jgi:hypothetical protein
MRAGEGTKNWKMEQLQERGREGKNGSGAEEQGAEMANAECNGKKTAPSPPIRFIGREACSPERTPRAH